MVCRHEAQAASRRGGGRGSVVVGVVMLLVMPVVTVMSLVVTLVRSAGARPSAKRVQAQSLLATPGYEHQEKYPGQERPRVTRSASMRRAASGTCLCAGSRRFCEWTSAGLGWSLERQKERAAVIYHNSDQGQDTRVSGFYTGTRMVENSN